MKIPFGFHIIESFETDSELLCDGCCFDHTNLCDKILKGRCTLNDSIFKVYWWFIPIFIIYKQFFKKRY